MIEHADARLLASPALGRDALERLRRSWVAVIGAGALGGPVIESLAQIGVGLCVVDPGVVRAPNLGNQGLPAASLGQPKARVRAHRARELNPDCSVLAFESRVEDLGLAALSSCQLLVSATDSRISRLRVSELSQRLGKVWLDAAVDGSGAQLLGTVTTYDGRSPSPMREGACFACKYGEAALAEVRREARGAGCPSWREPDAAVTAPTLQTSAFAGVVAGHLALFAIRQLLGRGDEMLARQLVIDCDGSPRIEGFQLRRNPRCPCHVPRLFPLRETRAGTLGALLARAGAELGAIDALLFYDRPLVARLRCSDCGAARELLRVGYACSDQDVRCSCGSAVEMAPDGLCDRLTHPQARRFAALRWSDLGLPPDDVVTALAPRGPAHFVVSPSGRTGMREESPA